MTGAAEQLDRTQRNEPGRQQRPDAGRVARRDCRHSKLAGRGGAQGIADKFGTATRPAARWLELEAHLGESGDPRLTTARAERRGSG